jgi:hypothetical protein
LAEGFEGRLEKLVQTAETSGGARLVLFQPVQKASSTPRFFQARSTVLSQRLAARGLIIAEQRSDSLPPPQDCLVVALIWGEAAKAIPEPPTALPEPAPAEWAALHGQTLRQTLQEWSQRAGWSLIWQTKYDYPIEAPARFPGDFPSAAATLLKGFSEADPAPSGRMFRANQVLIIQ